MSQLYKNATAVIVAAVAPDSSAGFLRTDRDRFVSQLDRFEFQLKLPGGTVGKLALARSKVFNFDHPLERRAWELQEYQLATRRIVFSYAEILVECREHSIRSVQKSYLYYDSSDLESGRLGTPISSWNWGTLDVMKSWR
jgi:hypothetical protein